MTGTVEAGAAVVLDAIEHRKHVVMVNAELDSLLGPILNERARQAGVVLTNTDGDEPGVAMTLAALSQDLGFAPRCGGQYQGNGRLLSESRHTAGVRRSRTTRMPERSPRSRTRRSCRWKRRFSPMRQAFAPAAAECMGRPARTFGRLRSACRRTRCLTRVWWTMRWARRLTPGLSSSSMRDSPLKKAQLAYYKLGNGPFYVFYTPFHLPHIQIASTIGRAVIHRDPTVAPMAGPVCEVVTMAKRDLKAGERLDGVGGFCAYGLIENAAEARASGALPIGLSEDCVLRRDKRKDDVVSFDDVELPFGRPVDALWREQQARWPVLTRGAQASPLRRLAGAA